MKKKMKTYKFYDTCSLLLKTEDLFADGDPVVISSITLNELENIKTSPNKDAETKYAARKLLHMFEDNPTAYKCWIFNTEMLKPIEEKSFAITDDTRILATAIDYDKRVHPDEVVFITNDLALKHIANVFFGSDSIQSVAEDPIDYAGYAELHFDDAQMEEFYSKPHENLYDYISTNMPIFMIIMEI